MAVGADFGVQDSLDVLMQKIQGAIDQGFPRIKLKFRPGWDLDMVAAVRSTFPVSRFTSTATPPTRRPTPSCSAGSTGIGSP